MTTLDLTHFNPGTQKEADFLAAFIARKEQLRFFLAQISAIPDGQAARHHLIVAPRGYGKTSLLRRIQIALRTEEKFATRFLALTFREEQHNVISLDIFWRNCLQALAEAREDEGAPEEELNALDHLWEQQPPRNQLKRDQQDGAPMFAAFQAECQRLGRRPVLLIDNLDSLLAGLGQHQWGLRATLQAADGPVLIAAAPRYPESMSDHDSAFFDFFRITTLPRLSDHEVMTCLRELAEKRGEKGTAVLQLLDNDPGRISALNTLAGGNPRTLGVLYTVLEAHMSDNILTQLSAMLDTFTGWYQARTEELPLQARAVFDALALQWDPMTAADLAQTTGLETQTVSSQLSRLEKSGFVEAVPLSKRKKTRNGYQVSERFFNIWYLMRNGSRRTRKAVSFLTAFLRACFSKRELNAMGRNLLRAGSDRVESCLAFASCMQGTRLKRQLLDHAEQAIALDPKHAELRPLVAELRNGKDMRATVSIDQAQRWFNKASMHYGNQEFYKAEQALRKAISIDQNNAYALNNLGLVLSQLDRTEEAENAYRKAIECKPNHVTAWTNLGKLFHNLERMAEAEEAYRKAIECAPSHAYAWHRLGNLLQDLDRNEEAEQAYRKAIECEPKYVYAWTSLGNLFQDLDRNGEAELAYRNAIECEPTDAYAWHRLGNLLQDLNRNEEAEQAYRKAIECEPNYAYAWTSLGHLLQTLGNNNEAEIAYRKAIESEPNYGYAWTSLGRLLQTLGSRKEAEQTYRNAIECEPSDAYAWYSLGNLLQDLDRNVEAEHAYRKAIECQPNYVYAWTSLGHLLQDLERNEEAEQVYRKAIECEPNYVYAWTSLGHLLQNLGRKDEAKQAYRKAIECEPNDIYALNRLGNLLCDHLGSYDDARHVYEQALVIDSPEPMPAANLAYLLALHGKEHAKATVYAAQAMDGLSHAGQHLLRAMLAWSAPDGGLAPAWPHLDAAISSQSPTLWTTYLDDLQRILAYAKRRGDGPALRLRMEKAKYDQVYAPLYHAVRALIDGEDHLLRINPEVRDMAEKIHAGAARMFVAGTSPRTT